MDKEQALTYLRENPVFWSRLGFCYDPPMLDEAGKPVLIADNFDELMQTHDRFSDAGVKIHTCILHNGWVGVDKYDYSLCDKVLESIFSSGKTEYYIPRIKLNPPVDWCHENPTEVLVYENGPRSVEEIRSLVGTLKQDYLGYESSDGYYSANGKKDSRPNVGGVISLQSFSSEKWLQDAGEALRRLVNHLEHSPWGNRILAYHIAYGACGESMLWGRQDGKFGDYGITNKKRFREWGLKKYSSQTALIEAWGSQCETEIIPPPHLREKQHDCSDDFYKNEEEDRWSIDYDLFTSEVNTDALMHFGKIVKENTADKPVGAFYGYILFMTRCAYSGHLGWKRLLESNYIDFFAAPKSYCRCAPGEPGGEMAPVVSINRIRLWVDECDNRTHLTVGDYVSNATCAEETYAVQLRELCKNISHNSGLWYMDLGGGWYNDAGIMSHITKLLEASAKVRKKPYRSVAQITVIVNEYSILCTHPSVIECTEDLLRNLQLTGTPVDVILSHDIGKIDLSSTRLAVLMNPLCMDNACIDTLRQSLSAEAHILYCGKTKAENGVVLSDIPGRRGPEYSIVPTDDCSIIWQNEDGVIAVQSKNGDFVLSTLEVGVNVLRKIVECAGVHCYAPKECTVYADNRIISFFPRKDMTFVPSLPESMNLTEMLSGKEYSLGSALVMKAKRGLAFLCNDRSS